MVANGVLGRCIPLRAFGPSEKGGYSITAPPPLGHHVSGVEKRIREMVTTVAPCEPWGLSRCCPLLFLEKFT